MRTIFTYNIGDEVFYLDTFNLKIKKGSIISRKIVDAPNFTSPPSLPSKDYNVFAVKGNQLGFPCEKYEIQIKSNDSIVLDIDKIFLDEESLIDSLRSK